MSAPDRANLWLVLAIWGAGLGAAAQFGKISVMFDLLAGVYPGAGIAFMVSVVGMVGLLFGTTAGLLVRRIGYRRVLVGALVLGAAMSALQALLPPFGLMMLSRVAEGVSHLAIVVTGPVLIAQATSPRHMGLSMSLWSTFFGLSFTLMAWFGGPFALQNGPSALFLVHAAYMAGFAVILWSILPGDAERSEQAFPGLAELLRQHGEIYRSPRVAAPALGFMFYTMMYVAVLTLLPKMAGTATREAVAALMPLVSIAVSLTLGVWLLRVMTAVHLVQAGFATALVAAVLLWLTWGADGSLIACSLLLAGALGLVQGASFNAIPQLNAGAEDRTRAAGAVAQLGNLGTTSGTPLLHALIGGLGVTGVLVFVAPLCLAAIAIHAWLARRRVAEQGS